MTTPRYEALTFNPTTELCFDPKNPSLTLDDEGRSQPELLEIMLTRFKIRELAESIIATGFNSFDPVVGWRNPDSDCVEVLEGNRRLAVAKVLLDPEQAPPRFVDEWREISSRLPSGTRPELEELAVRVYADRNDPDVLAYVGFRHVTGVLKWPALEKAKYIAKLVDDFGWTYQQVAEQLGSYARVVERHYVA